MHQAPSFSASSLVRLSLNLEQLERIDSVCLKFEEALQNRDEVRLKDFWESTDDNALDQGLFAGLLELELGYSEIPVSEISIQTYIDDFPEYRPIIELIFEQILQRFTETAVIDRETGQQQKTQQIVPACLGEYEILDILGRGGMGVVFRALDTTLGRQVALKVITGSRLEDEDAIENFKQEAQTAANFQNESIVTVHGHGEQDGFYYYSMELIQGTTVEKRIADGSFKPKEAASAAKTVAEAIAYAHAQNVIHRDIKPSNILYKSDDKVMVTDFGLAQRRTALDSNDTSPQQIVGTPSYMPPEQARGEPATEQSDVYGLGALLYAMITGNPPFKGSSLFATLQMVRDRDPIPPRQLIPSIPLDLQTICLKCLEKDPINRYETAAEVADDLQRFLDKKPIVARPVGLPAQTLRWCYRNPLAATTVALILLISIVSPVVAYNQSRLADDNYALFTEAEAALEESRKARKEAEESLGDAMFAVRTMVDEVASVDLRHAPGMERTRRKLLEESLAYYKRFIERNAGREKLETPLQSLLSRAQFNLGDIYKLLGEQEQAIEAYQASIKMFEQGESPDPLVLSTAYNNYGNTLFEQGKVEEAIGRAREALKIIRPALKKAMDQGADSLKLADTEAMISVNLASLLAQSDNSREAEKILLAAASSVDDLLKTNPDYVDLLDRSTGLKNGLAAIYFQDGRLTEGIALAEEAADTLRNLIKRDPQNADYRMQLVVTLTNAGMALTRFARHDKAKQKYQEALQVGRKLVQDFPHVPSYRFRLAHTEYTMAVGLVAQGVGAAVIPLYQKVIERLRSLHDDYPEIWEYAEYLARAEENVAIQYFNVNNVAEGQKHLAAGGAIWRKLQKKKPKNLSFRMGLGTSLALQARYAPKAEKISLYKEAIAVKAQLRNDVPENVELMFDLGNTYLEFSKAQLFEIGVSGRKAANLAVSELQKAVDIEGNEKRFRASLANAYFHRYIASSGLWRQGDLADVVRARELLQKLVSEYPDPRHQSDLAAVLDNLCSRSPDNSAAVEAGEEAIALRERLLSQADTPEHQAALGGSKSNLAQKLLVMGQSTKAELILRECISIQRSVLEVHPANDVSRRYLINHYMLVINALGRNGRFIESGNAALLVSDLLEKELAGPGRFQARRNLSHLDSILAKMPNAVLLDTQFPYELRLGYYFFLVKRKAELRKLK